MADPVRVPLSSFQQARFAAFQSDFTQLQGRLNDSITAIVAGTLDPATLQGWDIRLDGDAILCTPPAGPRLVPDIGPEGVSASAEIASA